MKVLMFGRESIATYYGWALEQAGHEVEFYVRPGRMAQYGTTIQLDLRDDRRARADRRVRQSWTITMREDLPTDHDYDAIFLSVNQDQLSTAVSTLAPHVGASTVVVFNNIWHEPIDVIAGLPAHQIVWAFPGAAGGFDGGTLLGGMLSTVHLGHIHGTGNPARHAVVRDAFRGAGFKVAEHTDFRQWLWFHYIVDTAIVTGIMKARSYDAFVGSRSALREAWLLFLEMVAVVQARGGISRVRAGVLRRLPAGLVVRLMQPLLRGKSYGDLMRVVMQSSHGDFEATSLYPRDVLATSRRLNTSAPILTATEYVFAARPDRTPDQQAASSSSRSGGAELPA